MQSEGRCYPAAWGLGSVFARRFLEIENPRIGLLSVGSEAAKGNRQVQESYQVLKESHLNFVGNVEGMDFFTNKADVFVCDGFVGNILMKFSEGLGTALSRFLEKRLQSVLSSDLIVSRTRVGRLGWSSQRSCQSGSASLLAP